MWEKEGDEEPTLLCCIKQELTSTLVVDHFCCFAIDTVVGTVVVLIDVCGKQEERMKEGIRCSN